MEQSLLANHERKFATPHCAWHRLLAREATHECEPLLGANPMPPKPRRHEPKAGADLRKRTTQAVRLRTAGAQNNAWSSAA